MLKVSEKLLKKLKESFPKKLTFMLQHEVKGEVSRFHVNNCDLFETEVLIYSPGGMAGNFKIFVYDVHGNTLMETDRIWIDKRHNGIQIGKLKLE